MDDNNQYASQENSIQGSGLSSRRQILAVLAAGLVPGIVGDPNWQNGSQRCSIHILAEEFVEPFFRNSPTPDNSPTFSTHQHRTLVCELRDRSGKPIGTLRLIDDPQAFPEPCEVTLQLQDCIEGFPAGFRLFPYDLGGGFSRHPSLEILRASGFIQRSKVYASPQQVRSWQQLIGDIPIKHGDKIVLQGGGPFQTLFIGTIDEESDSQASLMKTMPDGQKVSGDKEFISHIEALQKAKHRPNFVTLQVCSQDLGTRDRERTEGYPRVVDMQSRLSLGVKPNHPNTESFHMYRVVFPDSHILDVPISLNHFEAHGGSSEDMHRMTQEVLQRDFFKQITQAGGNVSHIDEQTLSNCFFRSARGSMDFPNNSGFLSTHMKWPGMNPFRDLLDAGCDKVWEGSIDEAAEIFAGNGTLELHEGMIIVFSYDLPHGSRKDGTYIPAVFGREYHSGVVVPADPRSGRKWDFLCDFGFLPYEVSGPIDMIANEYQYWLKGKSYGSRVTNFTIEFYRGKWGAR